MSNKLSCTLKNKCSQPDICVLDLMRIYTSATKQALFWLRLKLCFCIYHIHQLCFLLLFSALKHSPSKRQGKRDSIKKLTSDSVPDSNPSAAQTSTSVAYSGATSAVTVSHGNGKIILGL